MKLFKAEPEVALSFLQKKGLGQGNSKGGALGTVKQPENQKRPQYQIIEQTKSNFMSSTDESISKHRSKHNTSRLSTPVASTPVKIKFSGKVPGKKLYPLGIPDHFSNVILSTCFYCSPVENCQD